MMVERKAAGHTAATPEVERYFCYNGACMMVERKAAGRTAATLEVQHVFRYIGGCVMVEQKAAGRTQLLRKQRQMSASVEVTSSLPLFQAPSYNILPLTLGG